VGTDPGQPLIAAIGRRVKEAREGAGITQSRLARDAEVPTGLVAELERGEPTDLGVADLLSIAEALGRSARDLLPDQPDRP
jgi:transcriptional regulator with XRE-family HTH domain